MINYLKKNVMKFFFDAKILTFSTMCAIMEPWGLGMHVKRRHV